MTGSAVQGILRFCQKNDLSSKDCKSFGYGLTVYNYRESSFVHWLISRADSLLIAETLGALRFSMKFFFKAFYGFRGTFFVAKVGAEKHVSFDNGPSSSLIEDCYFGIKVRK